MPPRQSQSYSGYSDYRPYYGYNNYNSYANYGQYRNYGGYNSYSPYSTYSGYGYGGAPSGDVENRFFRNAEESTRTTFRMVETIVQTFSSLTMLLESTYFAIMNSFRAILSVAENIARLRSTVSQLFSTFALIRFIKWLYRKVMRIKGSTYDDLSNDELWKKYANPGNDAPGFPSATWSGLLMFSIFIVIPYLIHKISNNIKDMQTKGNDPEQWNKSDEPVYTATVLYDFTAANEDELTVRANQKVWLAPQSLQPTNCNGWYKVTDHRTVGLVPANYIQIVGQLVKKPKQELPDTTARLLDPPRPALGAPQQSIASVQLAKASKESPKLERGESSVKFEPSLETSGQRVDTIGESVDTLETPSDKFGQPCNTHEKSVDKPVQSSNTLEESTNATERSVDAPENLVNSVELGERGEMIAAESSESAEMTGCEEENSNS